MEGTIASDPHMGTEKPDISSIPFTSTPPFVHEWNEFSSTSELSSATPSGSRPVSMCSHYSLSLGCFSAEPFTVNSDPSIHPYHCFRGGARNA